MSVIYSTDTDMKTIVKCCYDVYMAVNRTGHLSHKKIGETQNL